MYNALKEQLDSFRSGETNTIRGRLTQIRQHKHQTFFDISDHETTIQVVLKQEHLADQFDELRSLNKGAYLQVQGEYKFHKSNHEILAQQITVLASAQLPVYPTPWEINGLEKKHEEQVLRYTSYYLANPQRAAVLKIKTTFVNALHHYFQEKAFTLVEPPILTDKALYDTESAVRADAQDESVYLSQCATFELEPLALVFGSVYTISPAFRNESTGSKRHLTEYTHAKAEVLFADINQLMTLASKAIYSAVKETVQRCTQELSLIGKEINLEPLKPENHAYISYEEALPILHEHGSSITRGKGLSRGDEKILTKEFGDKYVWVTHLPFESEGFPYKRQPGKPEFSMTCDLIAPHGAGEMVGVAEKTTDPKELINNLIEKGKKEEIPRFWEYIVLRMQGLPPHGGIGAAPERIIYGLLGLNHIKYTKPYPRYPGRKIGPIKQQDLNPWNNPVLAEIIEEYDL